MADTHLSEQAKQLEVIYAEQLGDCASVRTKVDPHARKVRVTVFCRPCRSPSIVAYAEQIGAITDLWNDHTAGDTHTRRIR